MIDAIVKFVSELSSDEELPDFTPSRIQLAQAALMYHVIAVDGVVTDEERERMSSLLADQFGVNPGEAEQLLADAQKADGEAIDLYAFTSVLKRTLDEEQRIAIVENLWEMVFADGVVHELEDNVVWRIAELLAVSSRDRVTLKQRVRDRQP